jgi:hypothetical protein
MRRGYAASQSRGHIGRSQESVKRLHLSAMSATTAYVAASVNRFNHSASCSKESLVAFGSSTLLALWDASVCVHYFFAIPN